MRGQRGGVVVDFPERRVFGKSEGRGSGAVDLTVARLSHEAEPGMEGATQVHLIGVKRRHGD